MAWFLRRLYVAFLVFVIAGCSGAGCGSCAGGAIQPIPGGYPINPVAMDHRLPHAMQVRLTDQGLRSIEGLVPGLLGSFIGAGGITIPPISQDVGGIATVSGCPATSPCTIQITLAPTGSYGRGVELSLRGTNQLSARIRLVLRTPAGHPIAIRAHASLLGLPINADLNVDVDTNRGTRSYIGLQVNVRIARDTHDARRNYFRVDLVDNNGAIGPPALAMGEDIEPVDIAISGGNILGDIAAGAINLFLKNTILGLVQGQLGSALGPINDLLAMKAMPNPPGCPTGTTVCGSNCCYPGGTDTLHQVPVLLGLDGAGDLGTLLASVTPGAHAPFSFVIGAGDPAHDARNLPAGMPTGMTLNFFGAVTEGQHSNCVPTVAAPPGVAPEYTTLQQNLIPGTTNPYQIGIGVSREFFDSALWNLWDSGAFCLGVTTRLSQQLSTGLISVLVRQLPLVTFPSTSASLALTLRPQKPPTVSFGGGTNVNTDPVLKLTFEDLSIDWYVFSEEHYVRFMTLTTKLSVPVNLMQTAAGLQPALGNLATEGTVITNAGLLGNANLTTLAATINTVLQGVVGMFVGGAIPTVAIPTIALPGGTTSLRIDLSNIQGVDDSSSQFLGVFANLATVPTGMPDTVAVDTTASAQVLPFDSAVYEFPNGFDMAQLPRVRLSLGVANSFGRDVEYSWRIDATTWTEWSRESAPVVTSATFVSPGGHTIEVRARMIGEVTSEDPEPARVNVVIDAGAPSVRLDRDGAEMHVVAHDDVDAPEALSYRYGFDGHGFGAWSHVDHFTVPDDVTTVTVEVQDSANHITQASQVRPHELIRGGPSTDATSGSGCGCSTPGTGGRGPGALAAVGGLASLLLLAARGRRRRTPVRVVARRVRRMLPTSRTLLFWSVTGLFFAGLGCNCGSPQEAGDAGRDGAVLPDASPDVQVVDAPPADVLPTCTADGPLCPSTRMCTMNTTAQCHPPRGQMASGHPAFHADTCTFTATDAECMYVSLPPLPVGVISHMNMAVRPSDNTVWLSAYAPGVPAQVGPKNYGDLIVGRYDAATHSVAWTDVDGMPAMGTMVGGDLNGFRGGITDPGPNVGQFNSIGLTSAGRPYVSYWDATNNKLKFGRFDGTAWHLTTLDPESHGGTYTSLVVLNGDVPAIAYRTSSTDMAGVVTTQVKFILATVANPGALTDWFTPVVVASAVTACRAADCATGQVCTKAGVCAAPSGTCATACASGQACIAAHCTDTIASNYVEDWTPGTGLFISMAADGDGNPHLVFYDRTRGNLMGASGTVDDMGPHWTGAFVIDGEAGGHDQGDRGLWSTLAIDGNGLWHVAYIDAYGERLLYTTVMAGVRQGAPEVVDTGAGIGTMAFTDGTHVVGDGASISVGADGTVKIVYQDSSAGTLRLATRSGTTWTNTVLDMANSAGYWSRISHGQIASSFKDMAANQFGARVIAAP